MAYIAKIKDTSGTTGVVASCLYGTCSSLPTTVAKTVTCSSFDTTMANCPTGLTIYVKFSATNTAANPTLNVNSMGAKNIYRWGTTTVGTTPETSWQDGAIVSFTYDGSAWIMNNHLDDTTYQSLAAATGGTAVSLVTTGEKASWNAKSGSDTNVTQTATDSTNASYEVLFSNSANNTTTTESARKTQYLTFNPYGKTLAIGGTSFNGLTRISNELLQVVSSSSDFTGDGSVEVTTYNSTDAVYGMLGMLGYDSDETSHTLWLTNKDATLSDTWDGTNTSLKTAIGSARDVVKQTATTTNATYELLFSGSANNTTSTEGTRKTNTLTYNPSTKALTTYGGEIALKWDSTLTPTLIKLYQADGTTVNGQIGCDTIQYTSTQTLTASGTTIDTTYQSVFESDEISCKVSNDISTTGSSILNYYSNLRIITNRNISATDTGKPYCDIVLTSNYSGGNATWDGTNASLRSAILGKLSRTGGTMIGEDQSWINVGKDPLIYVSKPSSASGAMSLIGGDTKNGRIVIATFPSTDDRIYFNYYTNTTLSGSTNKYDQSMKWDGSTNKLWFVKNGGGVVCQSEDGNYTCSLQVGAGGQARGLYDDTKSRWIIYSDSNGTIKTGATLVPPSITFSADAAISFQANSSAENTGEFVWWYYNGKEKCRIWADGSFSSAAGPQYRCYNSSGTSLYSGRLALASSSDIRLKKNVSDTEVTDALNIVNQIKMRSFDWKNTDEHQTIGFIADELELLDPNFVDKGSGGLDSFGEINPKSVNNFYLLGYVVKSLQELSKICQAQQKEIDSLKSKLG